MILIETIKKALVGGDPKAIELAVSIISNTRITSLNEDQVNLIGQVIAGQK
jgi:hypothetical protein